ncbi:MULTISPECIES: FG-GAP repeat domain-containing protein [unclassified Streptomyces]|uniref:FG-GAP repeat domain-containing protein n=1 Tax=unclassified Streptomyces TaxID=2593676 RepID=UPI00166087D7|nr:MULTISPECIES: VCBS repeat-containing protein [unclassified Streptomyces]MBD0707189.1 hypothetical protein [Streptomyces sp. CBMA291]MBD0713677.1 hypothetical protein [Streptomyces sp. CBMA370]
MQRQVTPEQPTRRGTRPARGRGLALAVTAVLAVTTVTGTLLTGPAMAAQAPAATAPTARTAKTAKAAASVSLPVDARIVSTGTTGFLTALADAAGQDVLTWTRFDGGGSEVVFGSRGYDTGSDTIVTTDGSRYTVRDMRTADQATIDPVRELGPGAQVVGVVGATLYVSVPSYGYQDLYQLQKLNGVMFKNKISYGSGDTRFRVFGGSRSAAGAPLILGEADINGVTAYFHTVYKGGQVYDYIRGSQKWDATATGAISDTYTAWTEHTPDGGYTLAVDKRSGLDPVRRIPLGHGPRVPVVAGFVGDWVLYGSPGGADTGARDPMSALTARHLVTGETTALLDHLTSVATGPDGSLLVRGGTVAEGEGLYRISDAGGRPLSTLEVGTGVPTGVRFLGQDVPPVLDTDINRNPTYMSWSLSHEHTRLDITLRHLATGKSFRQTMIGAGKNPRFMWNGVLDSGVPAPNGAYAWEAVATPSNGIGGPATLSGTTRVDRAANSHDYSDNGTADILARDASGTLWRDDSYDWYTDGRLYPAGRTKVGAGFQIYDLIEGAGNHAGAAAADFVARDKSGVLWSFLGKGDGTFAPRTRIGGGWGVYTKIAAGSDLTGDGRPDLVAVDTAGALWLYKATGKWDAPYAPRVKLAAGGYNTYDQMTAVGDVAGDRAGDVVARDTSGVLWLFLGKGNGTFDPRIRIGGGWGAFTHLVGMGDADNDGTDDLLAYGPGGTYIYKGTGYHTAPFRRMDSAFYRGEGTKFNSLS